ncbi:trichohyalin [Scaptodrosophila lebanonensis]|uniref:Trichohyalin n=1 Tax=Drosophila lebanonensis TaxID=7225 RepID=A0A6J2TVT9_DROLE|nr:trichohyalin [Scaptodrosophila lebanonensis]
MQYSWLPQEARQLVPRAPPAVIISQQRYERITSNATQAPKKEQQRQWQQRQRDQEQLRAGGEELLRQFGGRKLCSSIQEQCITEQRAQEQHKKAAIREAREKSALDRSEEQRVRAERIAKAQLLLEQLRPGPRELQCARLQSQVMRSVNVQRQLQMDFAQIMRAQRALDRRVYGEQVLLGLEQAQRQQAEQCQQQVEHKRELQLAIQQRRQERASEREAQLKQERAERERHEREVQQQEAKEREAQAQRQRQRREHALAALAMAKQQEQRLQMLDEVEQSKCEVHNEAKGQLDALKRELGKQRMQRRLLRNEQLALEIKPRLHYSAGEDLARHERQLAAMREAHSAEQRAHRERLEVAIGERVQTQRQEQAAALVARQQAEEQRRQDEAQRLQNEQIYLNFKRDERQQRLRGMHALRGQLDKQLQERAAVEAQPEINYNRNAVLETMREDEFFFNYAHQLMTTARNEGCPLKPFVRAVQQYKSDNHIDAGIRVPRHLVSKLTMGLRTEGDSQAATKQPEQPLQDSKEEQQRLSRIREKLQEIEKLVREEALERAKDNSETTKPQESPSPPNLKLNLTGKTNRTES